MDLDSILGGAKVPQTNVHVADSTEALEAIEFDEACSYVGLFAETSDKYFIVERIHYKNLTKDEKRSENIKLYKMLIDELKKYNISRNEAKLTFSDEYAVPEFIKKQHPETRPKPSYLMWFVPISQHIYLSSKNSQKED